MVRLRLLLVGLLALGACDGPVGEAVPPSRYALRGAWPDPSTLTYSLSGEGVHELETACARWAALGPVSFRAAAVGETPDFTVTWERGAHGSCTPFGADPSLAHTGPVPGPTFVHLDAGRNWSEAGGPALAQTILHELGHVLGLDHSPDPMALMYADPSAQEITRAERDALHTLYGGGTIDESDLVVVRDDEVLAVVHGVGTSGFADFELFDTDGDGDDELVVWRIDRAGEGELTAFHFAPGPRPERTVGPRLGMTAHNGTTHLVTTVAGTRLLVLEYPNGNRIVRRFDDDGHLRTGTDEELPSLEDTPARRTSGDLDGDGRRESVRRPGDAELGRIDAREQS